MFYIIVLILYTLSFFFIKCFLLHKENSKMKTLFHINTRCSTLYSIGSFGSNSLRISDNFV